MLSVGREINVKKRQVACQTCGWEGVGEDLSTGLNRINRSKLLLYAYRCPCCDSFNVACKGKVLTFPPTRRIDTQPGSKPAEGREVDIEDTGIRIPGVIE
jgi:hypothetical protein